MQAPSIIRSDSEVDHPSGGSGTAELDNDNSANDFAHRTSIENQNVDLHFPSEVQNEVSKQIEDKMTQHASKDNIIDTL